MGGQQMAVHSPWWHSRKGQGGGKIDKRRKVLKHSKSSWISQHAQWGKKQNRIPFSNGMDRLDLDSKWNDPLIIDLWTDTKTRAHTCLDFSCCIDPAFWYLIKKTPAEVKTDVAFLMLQGQLLVELANGSKTLTNQHQPHEIISWFTDHGVGSILAWRKSVSPVLFQLLGIRSIYLALSILLNMLI